MRSIDGDAPPRLDLGETAGAITRFTDDEAQLGQILWAGRNGEGMVVERRLERRDGHPDELPGAKVEPRVVRAAQHHPHGAGADAA